MSAQPDVVILEDPRLRAGMRTLAAYCVAHLIIDLYSSAAGAFAPLLVDRLHFSIAQAGLLGGIMVFAGSFLQPAYGYLSDRFHSRLFSVLAPAVAAIFIGSLGLAWNFASAAGLIFLGGMGIASFHPQATARATLGIEKNRARWLAVFISAGSVGLAIGPTYFTSLVQWLSMRRSYVAALPGALMTLFLLFAIREPEREPSRKRFDFSALRPVRKPLLILCVLVMLRSGIQITFGQLLPLFLHRERGFTLLAASGALSAFQICGAIGGYLGGHTADRFGGKRVIQWSMLGSVPLLALFFFSHGAASMIGLTLGGLVLLFTVPVNVVMAQELAPRHAGTVSALMMGFAWGLAGLIFIPVIGWLSDRLTMQTTMSALIVFPLIGFFLTLKLPDAAK